MITSKVKKIIKGTRMMDVFDVKDIPNHNFIANNIIIHNCDESIRFATSCIIGDTLIKTPNGNIKIKDLEGKKNFEILSANKDTRKIETQIAERCIKVKDDIVFELETEDGKKIQATKEHKFLTNTGWKMLSQLKEGDEIIGI